jgi:UV DNA damage repair endonuclease
MTINNIDELKTNFEEKLEYEQIDGEYNCTDTIHICNDCNIRVGVDSAYPCCTCPKCKKEDIINTNELIDKIKDIVLTWILKDATELARHWNDTVVTPKGTRPIDMPEIRRWMKRFNLTEKDMRNLTDKDK